MMMGRKKVWKRVTKEMGSQWAELRCALEARGKEG